MDADLILFGGLVPGLGFRFTLEFELGFRDNSGLRPRGARLPGNGNDEGVDREGTNDEKHFGEHGQLQALLFLLRSSLARVRVSTLTQS